MFDAIVIGSGASGSTAACVLTEGGARTLLIEAGPEIASAPARNGHDDLQSGGWRARTGAWLAGQRTRVRNTAYRDDTRHLYVDDLAHPYTTPSGRPFSWIRGRQLGGRLHTWSRMSPRFSSRELDAPAEDGVGHAWPLTESDLAPYYDRIERRLGLHGGRDRLAHLPDGSVCADHPMNAFELDFKRRVERRWPERHVIEPRVLGGPSDPVPAGIQDALDTGRLTLLTERVARRVLTDGGSGEGIGVETVSTSGDVERHLGGRVLLCASAFESVRLLMNSAGGRHAQGIGNHSGLLGRGVMDHLLYISGGRIPDGIDPAVEPTGSAARHPRDFDSQGFYLPRVGGANDPRWRYSRGFGFQGGIGRDGPWWWLAGFGEMLPRQENGVTLDPHRRDRHGIPALRIDVRHGVNDRRMLDDMRRTARSLLRESGLLGGLSRIEPAHLFGVRRWWKPGRMRPGLAIHECGGAPMGDDPRHSVVDAHGKVWHASNISVCDSAVFPSCGYQNPTLTIMALAARSAEQALEES